jgi:nitrate reductase gamma subunit
MSFDLDQLLFGLYPYVCLTVFFVGSLVRFDREQYTWRSGSSQLLRRQQLRLGSNLFHVGVLFLLFGHFFGMLTPHWLYEHFISAGNKQVLAMVSGGIAGTLALVGLTILLHRRLSDPRIRVTSAPSDIAVAVILWLQLALGLATIPLSAQHMDGTMMLALGDWAQRIATLGSGAAAAMAVVPWVFKVHMFLGLTLFLLFPFTRLVHIWSGFGALAYAVRAVQLVRGRGQEQARP